MLERWVGSSVRASPTVGELVLMPVGRARGLDDRGQGPGRPLGRPRMGGRTTGGQEAPPHRRPRMGGVSGGRLDAAGAACEARMAVRRPGRPDAVPAAVSPPVTITGVYWPAAGCRNRRGGQEGRSGWWAAGCRPRRFLAGSCSTTWARSPRARWPWAGVGFTRHPRPGRLRLP